ncbi:hypothetical protein EG68_09519 [Paragonimus skrjabini miyazakii]|uniref:Uncharacterized protein n=1 Tax=Paragonimus skrjabini miyazakii TaxID=59628 RepID=A0A8S9YGF6_9TREM|nr:hypothetical protein EG68_09519 [Paragonimus skrjabini miyazakii]
MEAQITFNNSKLLGEDINYTCPAFKELAKATLNSRFFNSSTSYLWRTDNNLERHQYYHETTHQTHARTEIQITSNNSRLLDEDINYTCPPFKELVKDTLNSRFFNSSTSYMQRTVILLG